MGDAPLPLRTIISSIRLPGSRDTFQWPVLSWSQRNNGMSTVLNPNNSRSQPSCLARQSALRYTRKDRIDLNCGSSVALPLTWNRPGVIWSTGEGSRV